MRMMVAISVREGNGQNHNVNDNRPLCRHKQLAPENNSVNRGTTVALDMVLTCCVSVLFLLYRLSFLLCLFFFFLYLLILPSSVNSRISLVKVLACPTRSSVTDRASSDACKTWRRQNERTAENCHTRIRQLIQSHPSQSDSLTLPHNNERRGSTTKPLGEQRNKAARLLPLDIRSMNFV